MHEKYSCFVPANTISGQKADVTYNQNISTGLEHMFHGIVHFDLEVDSKTACSMFHFFPSSREHETYPFSELE